MSHSCADGFQVYVRIRPLKPSERGHKGLPWLTSNENEVTNTQIWLHDQRYSIIRDQHFAFHRVFPETSPTSDVYQKVGRPLIASVVSGFNATCFAYGMTGAGKTHTMFGDMYFPHAMEPGIVPLALHDLFSYSRSKSGKCTIKVSYLEIYNEMVRDLLPVKATSRSQGLLLVEDPQKGVVAADLCEFVVANAQEVGKLVLEGNNKRTMAPTGANQFSSRSHAVLQFSIETKSDRKEDVCGEVSYSKLCLIDLAGSERAAATENRGARLLEGANINKSLLALGNCINILSDPEKSGKFVPYRDSKLTRLLKDALGGRTRTAMIACVSPTESAYEETLHTLKYAERARKIKVSASRNVKEVQLHVSEYKAIIAALRSEIETLKEQIRSKDGLSLATSPPASPAETDSLDQELMRNFEEFWEVKQSIQEVETLNSENKKQVKSLLADLEYVESLNDGGEESRLKTEIRRIRDNIHENEEELKSLNKSLQTNMKEKARLQRMLATLQNDRQRDLIRLQIAVRTLKMEKMDLYIQNQEMKQRVESSQKISDEKEKVIVALRLEVEEMKRQLMAFPRRLSDIEVRSDELSPRDVDTSSVQMRSSHHSSTSFTLSSPADAQISSELRKPLFISDLHHARALRKCKSLKVTQRSESAEGFLCAFAGVGDETTMLKGVKEQLGDEETDPVSPPPKPIIKVAAAVTARDLRTEPQTKASPRKANSKHRDPQHLRSSSNSRERGVAGLSARSTGKKSDLSKNPPSMANLLASLHKKILTGYETESLAEKYTRERETPRVVISLKGGKLLK